MSHKKCLNQPRRRFLRNTAGVAAAATVAFPMILTSSKTHAANIMTMLAWYGNGEPDLIGAFEEAHQVKISSKYYTSGDHMLAVISHSPPGTFDVILSDAEYVTQLRAADYLEKLDPSDYPFDDFFPEFQQFPAPGFWEGNDLYAVPVSFGFLGLTYNTEKISAKKADSYAVLWDSQVRGKVGHLDWGLPSLGCLSLSNRNPSPFDLSPAAFSQLRTTTLSLRPWVKGFFNYGGVSFMLKSGEVYAMCGIGDWISGVLEKQGAPITTVVPSEGGIQFTEALGIGKNANKPDLAKKLVQYLTSPEGQVRKALLKAYPTAVTNRIAWQKLNDENPAEARRAKMDLSNRNMITDIRDGRVHLRQLPTRQPEEDWDELWFEYKKA